MKGDVKIISYLNKLLGNELVAINQYFLHARMFKNWGLMRLNDIEYHESVRISFRLPNLRNTTDLRCFRLR